ncbi:MAG: sulfatase-like hydrolase/transferase [Actinomycetota bacterium]|nr:sulfatase-like hydrolase/transferase [Actinomycetota bacterium]
MRKRTLTRRDFLKMTGAGMAGATLIGTTGCDLPERIRNITLDPPGVKEGTNVVLIIIDSLRKDHIGVYGNDKIRSPNLDALAKDSLLFTKAYPESIPTICARRAIHTGLRTWPFRDWVPPKGEDIILQGWEPIPNYQTTLAEMMQAAGYGTYFVTDNMHQFKPSYNIHRGFDVFDFFRGQTTDNYRPAWTYPKDKVAQALLKGNIPAMTGQMRQYFANVKERKTEADWFSPMVFSQAADYLEVLSKGGPFFLTVDSYDPHEPWDPPERYLEMYDDEPYNLKEPFSVIYGPSSYLLPRELERMKARYSAEVTMTDRWLGRFLDKMEELGLFDNTLLILLSDHGVAHGEHGYTGKPDNVLWPEVTDIPFYIRHPEGKGAGQTSGYYASTHDVAPTILGFLGIEPRQELDGQDLSVVLGGGKPEARPHFTIGYNDHVWARDDRYVMFSTNQGADAKLYDVEQDPGMHNDIAGVEPNVVKRMFEGYIIRDAGGPLPTYDYGTAAG